MGKLKRYKWLFKNLTFIQLVKYVLVKKPVITGDMINEDMSKACEINTYIKVDNTGTLLIKPSGIKYIKKIMTELSSNGVTVEKSIKILDYKKYAKTVFYMVSDREQAIWTAILERYYKESCNYAILLYLNKNIDDIAGIKTIIRKKIGIDFFKVKDGKNSYITSITPIHSSNIKERVFEESVVIKMLEEGKACVIDFDKE